jgi:hypothetical protein
VSRFESIIAWSEQARELVRLFGDKSVGAEELRQHVITLLSDYAHLFAAGGEAKQAFEALQGACPRSKRRLST